MTVFGTVSPGHSIGTLNVDGPVSFQSGSTFLAEVGADGSSDLLAVNGPVSIADGARLGAILTYTPYTEGHSWQIISATGGVDGTFSVFDPGFVSYTVSLEQMLGDNSLNLVLVRTPYETYGETKNEAATGSGLDALLPDAQSEMADLLASMDFDMNPDQLSATLKGLNPEMYTAFPAAELEISRSFSRMMKMHQRQTNAALTTEDGLWNVWAKSMIDRKSQEKVDGVSGYDFKSGGGVMGADRSFGEYIRAGFMFGYSSGNFSFYEGAGSGSVSGRNISLYADGVFKGFNIDGSAGFTDLNNSGGRQITTPLFSRHASASFDSNAWNANLSVGYDFILGKMKLGPLVSLDYIHLSQDHILETGAGQFDVSLADSSSESLTTTLGAQLSGDIEVGKWFLEPRITVGLLHEFKNDPDELTANFVNYPEASFNVESAKHPANMAVYNLGLTADYQKNLSLYVDFSSELNSHLSNIQLVGGLSWHF